MSYNVLESCLLELFDHGDEDIRKDVCRVIANITSAGDQIQTMIDAGIFPKLIELITSEGNIDKEEAVCAVYNTILSGNPLQVWYLIHIRVIPVLCRLLLSSTLQTALALDRLERILRVIVAQTFERLETVVKRLCDCYDITTSQDLRILVYKQALNGLAITVKEICDCGGMETVQSLRHSCDSNVSSCANHIMDLVFGTHLISDDPERALPSIQYYHKILCIGK